MSGRPHALDEVRQAEVCALISTGVSLRAAARYIGCDRGTIRREQLRNEQFAANLRQAEMRAEYSPLEAMHDAARQHWRAAAWLLERTRPQQYAPGRAKEAAKLQIVRELAERMQELLAAELASLPNGKSLCRRLKKGLAQTCRELTADVAYSPRPKQPRPAITAHEPTEHAAESAEDLGLICLGDLPPLERNANSQPVPCAAAS